MAALCRLQSRASYAGKQLPDFLGASGMLRSNPFSQRDWGPPRFPFGFVVGPEKPPTCCNRHQIPPPTFASVTVRCQKHAC